MSLAEIISIMPSVASRTRTGNSNLSNFSAWRKPTDMISVTTEPTERQHLHEAGERIGDERAAERLGRRR